VDVRPDGAQRVRVASGDGDPVAGAYQGFGGGPADPGRTAADKG